MTSNHRLTRTIIQYLSLSREDVPNWLQCYNPGDYVPFSDFMSGRIGFYPGCGSDGQLIKLCNLSHSVHTFLYVDYMLTREDLEELLHGPHSIRGYHIIGKVDYHQKDLLPQGIYPLYTCRDLSFEPTEFTAGTTPFCTMYVWERDSNKDEIWGAEKIATTFINTDGIATYYQLFVKEYRKAPWIMLLQDHGLGCNYEAFGENSILNEIAVNYDIFPEYILWGVNGTSLWHGYSILGCLPEKGGMHNTDRRLCIRNHNITTAPELKNYSLFFDKSQVNFPQPANSISGNNLDPLYDEAYELFRDTSIITTSDLQRKFCIGYERAVRLAQLLANHNILPTIFEIPFTLP